MTNRSYIAIVVTALLLTAFLLAGCQPKKKSVTHSSGVFSWSEDVLEGAQRTELFNTMEELGLKELYQYFPIGTETQVVNRFVFEAENRGIGVWMLIAEQDYALNTDNEVLSEQLVKAVIVGRMRGIMVDVQPQMNKLWAEDPNAVMENYVRILKQGRKAAQEVGLEWAVCVPDYFDEYGQLKSIIHDGADTLAVRNYSRGNEAGKIAESAALCKKYGCALINVYALGAPGQNGLEADNTYYGQGMDAVLSNWETLQGDIGGQMNGVSFSYALDEYRALSDMVR